jgi:hypothetical protein
MYSWAEGTKYGWWLEMILYLSLLLAVIAAILVQYTITESLLQCPLEKLIDSPLKSHIEKTPNREE